jgi:putative ABC transport system permease protein
VYGFELVAGEAFNPALSDSSNRGMILNEAAVTGYGWKSFEEALTKTLNRNANPVRGVFKNYHFKGLQNPIEPLGMFLFDDDFRYITLVYEPKAIDDVVKFAEKKFEELFPDGVFDYFFLDEDFDKQYKQEKRLGRLVLIFTILGIFIASLGLIGMISFFLENKNKQIGIRKVNGAMVKHIFWLLIRDSSLQIVIAFALACPLAWFGARAWLQDFTYRTDLSWWIFVASGLLAWFLALAAISIQSLRAARENPIHSLRYE